MQLLERTTYHKILRVTTVVCACVLVFQSGLFSDTTAQLGRTTQTYLSGAVGMSARVQPTELNQITAALTAQQQALDAREAALRDREIAIGLNTGSAPTTDTSTFILSGILFILLVLIVLNYTLDFVRAREQKLLAQ